MSGIRLASNLSLPLSIVTESTAILAKRRVGKSYAAGKIVEGVLRAKHQAVIVDPKGDWWGLRAGADGDPKGGLPVLILGGEHGDLPLEVGAGELVARMVVEDRVSCVLDLSTFRKHEIPTFMTPFLESLYRLKAKEQYRTPVLLTVDEADAIAPQKPPKGEERMLGAIEDIVRRGGQRGLGSLLVTQRSAVLNKNVLTQTEILIILRTIAPQDREAMKAWYEIKATPEQIAEVEATIASLPKGDAWVWAPGWPTEDGIFKRIHVEAKTTFDSSATPDTVGAPHTFPKALQDIDLETLERRMAATVARVKADDPVALKARIRELETAAKKEQFTHAQKLSLPTKEVLKVVEKPILRAGELERAERMIATIGTVADKLKALLGELGGIVTPLASALSAGAPTEKKPYLGTRVGAPAVRAGEHGTAVRPAGIVTEASRSTALRPRSGNARDDGPARTTDLGKGERIILSAIAQHGDAGVTRDQLTVLTGYKKSSRDTYLQRLLGMDLIAPQNGAFIAEDAGKGALGSDYQPLPTGDALRDYWLNRLTAGEKVILATLTEAYPESLTRDELSERVDYKRSSRDTYLQRLISRKLVTADRGTIRASEALFG